MGTQLIVIPMLPVDVATLAGWVPSAMKDRVITPAILPPQRSSDPVVYGTLVEFERSIPNLRTKM